MYRFLLCRQSSCNFSSVASPSTNAMLALRCAGSTTGQTPTMARRCQCWRWTAPSTSWRCARSGSCTRLFVLSVVRSGPSRHQNFLTRELLLLAACPPRHGFSPLLGSAGAIACSSGAAGQLHRKPGVAAKLNRVQTICKLVSAGADLCGEPPQQHFRQGARKTCLFRCGHLVQNSSLPHASLHCRVRLPLLLWLIVLLPRPAQFYGEITQQLLKNAAFPGSNNGTGLFQACLD